MKPFLLTGCILFAALVASAAQIASTTADPSRTTPEKTASLSGKVVETTNTAGYTYLLVDTGSKKSWVAAPALQVKVGDTVAVTGAMPMPNYHSKTLNKDFEVVYFAAGVAINGNQPMAAGQPPGLPKGHPPITSPSAKTAVDLSGIVKAEGGKTVAEIFAAKDSLKGQPAKVRGRVVKYNPNIMGKNWLHIRDGSGGEGSNDLLITTAAEAKIGDKVLVSGTVVVNQDFGSGYKYSVMVENAKVVVE